MAFYPTLILWSRDFLRSLSNFYFITSALKFIHMNKATDLKVSFSNEHRFSKSHMTNFFLLHYAADVIAQTTNREA